MKNKRDVNGVLILDKPQGLTSNAALQRAKHLYCANKAGHTGSLDPLATGVLPLCFGEATKFANYLLTADKTYQVTALLGTATDTADAEGAVIETLPVPSEFVEQLPTVCGKFIGVQQQIPPMYSALKQQGRPLYELARLGISVPREAREITIYDLKILHADRQSFTLWVHCSKGTYIRTLIEDIARALSTCAHVSALRRLTVGGLSEQHMHSMADIEKAENPLQLLLSVESTISHLPKLTLSAAASLRMRHGNVINNEDPTIHGLVRLYSHSQQFLGIGEINEQDELTAKRLVKQ